MHAPLAVAFGRRRVLRDAALLAAASLAVPGGSRRVLGQPRFGDYPFKLGVASGDPLADGFVIWTRLAPDPLDEGGGGGMPVEAVTVRWEVARDPAFLRVVRRGTAPALPERGHAVHVEVDGLEPDRWYWYRFVSGGEASPIGRARTFPVAGAPKERLRFAFASCQHYGQGFFNAYAAMLEDELDFILHLGDYIYESDWGPRRVRPHLPEPQTLDDYRRQHALYKGDRDLQAAHAAYPFLVTWDDHEVENDYANAQSENGDPAEEFLRRRAAAYQAYYEHMPLRRTARPVGPDMRLYTSAVFGDLAHFVVLDGRQYRSDQPCGVPGRLGGQLVTAACAERTAEERTMLGPEQERWALRQLGGATGAWKVVAQQQLMAEVEQRAGGAPAWWSDGWDGYPAARRRLLGGIAQRRLRDVVALGGDIHSFWVTDLKADFADPSSATVATEFVGTSVTSAGPPLEAITAALPDNPHVRFFEGRERGYARVEATPSRWRTDFRAVRTIAQPDPQARTLNSWVVERGQAGAKPA
jgi:alkaline phosphatase D